MEKKGAITLEKVATKIDKLATLMVESFEGVHGEIAEIKQNVKQLKRDVGEMKVDLEAVVKAIDKDAVTIVNHERRIKILESAR